MLTIKNVSRRMHVFNLDHVAFQDGDKGEHGYKTIHTVVVDHGKNGALAMRKIPKNVPSSLTLAAGETRDQLPDAVADCLSVKRALADGTLRVVAQSADTPAPPTGDTKVGAGAGSGSGSGSSNDKPSTPPGGNKGSK